MTSFGRWTPMVCATLLACGATTRSDGEPDPVLEHPVSEARPAPKSEPRPTPRAAPATGVSKPPLPVDLRKPRATRTVLHRSSTIFEGEVLEISTAYDERLGPRTIAKVRVHDIRAGQDPGSTVEVSQHGGPVPDGSYASASDSVEFEVGARYVFFLSNERWHFTPWVADPLRVKTIAEEQLLVGPEGQVVAALEPHGISYGIHAEQLGSAASANAAAQPTVLRKSEFFELLEEAMDVEGIRPSGSFIAAPTPLGSSWRQIHAAPPQRTEEPQP
jgi:hypothetical protein